MRQRLARGAMAEDKVTMNGKRWLAVAALAGFASMSQGCVETVIGAAATTATAASQERGLEGAVSDTTIRATINKLWFDANIDLLKDVSLSVIEGRVLLTGRVPTPAMRVEAVRLAWQAQGVREVINELQVSDQGSVSGFARDTWISAQLKTKLLFDSQVSSINYSIETDNGVIYLMGIAQNEAELDRVTNIARNLPYVRRVVSYVRLKDDPRRPRS